MKKYLRRWGGIAAVAMATGSAFGQGSPNITWIGHTNEDRINAIIFNPAGDTVISGSSDRQINFWRASDGRLLQTLNTNAPFVHESAIEWLAITRDGTKLASCSYSVVKLWTLPQGTERQLNGHTDWVVSVAFSPDGQLLASASFDKTVKIWRVSDGALLRTISNDRQMRVVAFSPDGSTLAGSGGDGVIHLWRTSDWTEIRALEGHLSDIYVLAFSPDGSRIASGGYDQTVKMWSVNSNAPLYSLGGNNGNIYGIAFTPDGSQFAYSDGEGNTVRVHRVSDGVRLRLFDQNVSQVQCVAFSPQGLLAYGRVDERVVLARLDGTNQPPPPPPPAGNWTLTTTTTGTGRISVNTAPNGPNGTYVDGTVVQLAAVPVGTNKFLRWSGAATGVISTISVTMNADKTVNADFTIGAQLELLWQAPDAPITAWVFDGLNYADYVFLENGHRVSSYWLLRGVGDLNRDAKKDVVFENTDGRLAVWFMNGENEMSQAILHDGKAMSPGWHVAGTGDFNADGRADILFHHDNGVLALWLMEGANIKISVVLNNGIPTSPHWRIAAVADFNRDGDADILWHHELNGTTAIWFMERTERDKTTVVNGPSMGSDRRIVAAGDFNNDRQTDVLWQRNDGELVAWFLNKGSYSSAAKLGNCPPMGPEWTIVGTK